MAFLQLGAVIVPVQEGTFESEPERIGDRGRAVSGRLRAAITSYRYTHTFTTALRTAAEQAALIALFGTVVAATGTRFPTSTNVLVEPEGDETVAALAGTLRQLQIRLTEQ